MKEITHTQLENLILDKVKGTTFLSMRTITKQSTLNKGTGVNAMIETIQVNPDNIKKHTDIVGLVSGGKVDFQDFVNNRLLKEAKDKGKEKAQLTFEVGARKWGTHIKKSPALVEHTNKKGVYERYLVLFCVANNKPKVKHTYESKTIDLTEARFDNYRKPSRSEGGNQGTESPIIVRDFAFNNIKEISLFKETYKVVPDPKP